MSTETVSRFGIGFWLATFSEMIRALVLALGIGVLIWPLARMDAVAAATMSAFCGTLGGYALSRTQLRTSFALLASLLVALLILGTRTLWFGSADLANALGPAFSLRAGQTIFASAFSFVSILGLRFLSSRKRLFSLIELSVVAFAFGQLLLAHRGGAINRPFGLADPIIALGGDPTVFLLAFGALGCVFAVSLLLRERNIWRRALHIGTLLAVLALAVTTTQVLGLPTPEPSGGVGLRQNDDSGESGKGEQEHGPNSGDASFDSTPPPPSLAQAPIGVVLFHDDYSPPSGWYYFRQSALSQYNGRRLVSASGAGVNDDLVGHFPQVRYDVQGAPKNSEFRKTIETTMALLVDDHTQPPALEAPSVIQPATNPDPSRFRRVYRVESSVVDVELGRLLGAETFASTWSVSQRAHYTEAPNDERYEKLNDEIFAALPLQLKSEPVAKALAITGWLGKNGIYSLKHRHSGKDDPTASFLFGDRTGYCVHFAHAATFLMRQAGLPARVATGYAVDEATRQGGSSLVLTDADSHAWPELYVDGAGWIVMDVAPEQSLDPPAPPRDADLQRLMGELARGAKPIVANQENIEAMLERAKGFGVSVGQAFLGALLTFVLLMFGVKLWRSLVPYVGDTQSLPRLQYRSLLDRLSEVSIYRNQGESREAFADRIANELPSFENVTDLHVAAAFGSSTKQSDHLRSLAKNTQGERCRAYPLWKRLLGAINPISWWWSR